MSWNFRVIKDISKEEELYSIHEVYYHEDDKDQTQLDKIGWTENPIRIGYMDSMEDLKWYHKTCKEAFQKPVIVIDNSKPDGEQLIGEE